MKIMSFIQNFERKHGNATLFIGVALGIGIGMYVFAWFVPTASESMRMYYANKNMEHVHAGKDIVFIKSGMVQSIGSHAGVTMSMPVMSETQFLNDMVLHHEDAVRMAHQVLGLVGISENVKKLAESIISSQSAEISLMNEWLEASKTTKATTK